MTTQQVRVDGVDIAYTDTGSGPTILFVHGVYVTGALWNDVVSELGGGFRCVVPTWPLGAHSTPTGGADIGAEATARRIVHFIEALDLRDVTVVANDTGGGLVLTALGDATVDKSRFGRLVLTNCDSYEHFPPSSFAHIVKLCRLSSTVGGAILRLLATGGTLVISGVEPPKRFEWTPLYFKELRVIGSNGFGIEEVGGVAKHAMEHYFDFVAGGLDLTPVITHRFPLDRWDEAVLTLKDSRRTGAVKVLLEPGR